MNFRFRFCNISGGGVGRGSCQDACRRHISHRRHIAFERTYRGSRRDPYRRKNCRRYVADATRYICPANAVYFASLNAICPPAADKTRAAGTYRTEGILRSTEHIADPEGIHIAEKTVGDMSLTRRDIFALQMRYISLRSMRYISLRSMRYISLRSMRYVRNYPCAAPPRCLTFSARFGIVSISVDIRRNAV